MGLLSKADQLEQPPGAMAIGVLVEHTLACTAAQLLRLSWIREQIAIGVDRLLCILDDDGFATIAAPADASSNGRHEDDA